MILQSLFLLMFWSHDVVTCYMWLYSEMLCVFSRSMPAGFWTQMFSMSGWMRKTTVWMRGMFQSFFANAFTSKTTRFVWSCGLFWGIVVAFLRVVFLIINTHHLQLSHRRWRQLWTMRLSFSDWATLGNCCFLYPPPTHPPSAVGLQVHPHQKTKALTLSSLLRRQKERKEGVRSKKCFT